VNSILRQMSTEELKAWLTDLEEAVFLNPELYAEYSHMPAEIEAELKSREPK
jgi:hypothetical protein